jgi:hypothetical protein
LAAQGGAARRVEGRCDPDGERLEEGRDGVQLADRVLVEVREAGGGLAAQGGGHGRHPRLVP